MGTRTFPQRQFHVWRRSPVQTAYGVDRTQHRGYRRSHYGRTESIDLVGLKQSAVETLAPAAAEVACATKPAPPDAFRCAGHHMAPTAARRVGSCRGTRRRRRRYHRAPSTPQPASRRWQRSGLWGVNPRGGVGHRAYGCFQRLYEVSERELLPGPGRCAQGVSLRSGLRCGAGAAVNCRRCAGAGTARCVTGMPPIVVVSSTAPLTTSANAPGFHPLPPSCRRGVVRLAADVEKPKILRSPVAIVVPSVRFELTLHGF